MENRTGLTDSDSPLSPLLTSGRDLCKRLGYVGKINAVRHIMRLGVGGEQAILRMPTWGPTSELSRQKYVSCVVV